MKRLMIIIISVWMVYSVAVASAQTDSLIPSESYLQTADSGTWQVVDSEHGILTLSGISPRLQYIMTYPRLWSVTLNSTAFIETWMTIDDDIPLEAILSFDSYNVRVLLGAPTIDATTGAVSFMAQVLEVVNFVDETNKSIPLSFAFPTLTIQPTFDFTLALMDNANTRLAGTRNADVCAILHNNYISAYRAFEEFVAQGGGRRNPREYVRLQTAYIIAYKVYADSCL